MSGSPVAYDATDRQASTPSSPTPPGSWAGPPIAGRIVGVRFVQPPHINQTNNWGIYRVFRSGHGGNRRLAILGYYIAGG